MQLAVSRRYAYITREREDHVQSYRILIVEDEDEQALVLNGYLERYSAEREASFEVSRMRSAIELGEEQRFDLIFMDIDLPGMTGMEAARQLRTYNSETQIIFVTNLSQYAVRGYEVRALDFMVKPVRYVDFKIRMDKALRVIARAEDKTLLIPTREGTHHISARDLVFADVLDHDLAYHMNNGKVVKVRASLNKLQDELAGLSFVRISKSCIVNMRYVVSIAGPELRLTSGDVIYISRSMRKAALTAIANYYGGNS